MPVKLVEALQEMLVGWQQDLPAKWRPLLDEVELGYDQCDGQLNLAFWEPIFPTRLNDKIPGEPDGVHILHAFDGIDPENVRCIILGQDPYPSPEFATGRAFEAGNVAEWRELNKMFSKSVRVFIQQICEARTGNHAYARTFDDWPKLLADIENAIFDFEPPDRLADHWVGQGVLLLNSSLTLSRFKPQIDVHQSRGHLPLWRPLIQEVLKLCDASTQPVAFIAFGEAAIENFRLAGIEGEGVFKRSHPAEAQSVLALENPFIACNHFLGKMGTGKILW